MRRLRRRDGLAVERDPTRSVVGIPVHDGGRLLQRDFTRGTKERFGSDGAECGWAAQVAPPSCLMRMFYSYSYDLRFGSHLG
jgi:hypothetical protein